MIDMKKCTKCGELKDFEDFKRDNSKKDGRYSSCKSCVKDYRAKHYKDNKSKYKVKAAISYGKHKVKVKKRVKEYHYNRIQNDPLYKLKVRLRTQVYKAMKKGKWIKSGSNEKLLGCSFEYVKYHLESNFSEGMSWDNYGEWHIDHIKPLATANSREEIEKLFHYTNLQPLWAEDNLEKASKYEEKEIN